MDNKRGALIVELSPARRSVLGATLRDLGFPFVVDAVFLPQAFERLETAAIDILFVEVAQGDDEAFALIGKLRTELGRNSRVPIVVVSPDSHRALIEKARDAGANGFVTAPYSRASLHRQIAQALNDRRAYIQTPSFSGPDRRWRQDPSYTGPERRAGAEDELYVA